MTESQIGEYQALININLNKIKRQVNQIEPGGANRKRFNVINCMLEDIRRTVEIIALGVYIIKDWRIVGRLYAHGEQYECDFKDMINDIDSKQPEHMQLTREERERIPEVYEDVMKYRNKA